MQEVKIANKLGLKAFINGVPDLSRIPKEFADSFISAIEVKISEGLNIRNGKEH